MKLLTTLFAAACIVLMGCSSSEPEAISTPVPATNTPIPATNTPPPPTYTPTPEFSGDPEKGFLIFENGTEQIPRVCIECHSLDGREGPGPSLEGISERAEDRIPELSAAEYLRQSIVDSEAFKVEGFEKEYMGGVYKYLSEEEVDNLIAFLLTQ